ncbi:MAG TPA: hypothetical protein VJC13_00060 [Candidatus Paceibacterota bacterium]|nr:hypothetical protein [uncultured archaeon]
MTSATNTKTLLTVKIDKKLKLAAQKTAKYIGIPLGTFINSSLKDFVRTKEVRLGGETPNKKTIQAILQAEKEFARGEYEGPFTVEELKKEWKLV